MSIGYFGVPGETARGRVHIVVDGKPLCGSRIGPRAEFQWCAAIVKHALSYVECRRCLKAHKAQESRP